MTRGHTDIVCLQVKNNPDGTQLGVTSHRASRVYPHGARQSASRWGGVLRWNSPMALQPGSPEGANRARCLRLLLLGAAASTRGLAGFAALRVAACDWPRMHLGRLWYRHCRGLDRCRRRLCRRRASLPNNNKRCPVGRVRLVGLAGVDHCYHGASQGLGTADGLGASHLTNCRCDQLDRGV
jgi:hypothetical protein